MNDSDRPNLRMVAPEDAPAAVRMTDCLFGIHRSFSTLSDQFEDLFVIWSDMAHGSPDEE